jgi:hypothetical protein
MSTPMTSRLSPQAGRPAPVVTRPRRALGVWVLIGVPVLLGLLFAWQLASGFMRTEIVVRGAVAVSRVSLEPDPVGARVDVVIVDRVGSETTVSGDVTVKVREPDGSVWQSTRSVAGSDFTALPTGGLLSGRLGYSVPIPAADWVRAPRRGGAATVSVTVQASDGSNFSTIAEERFP